MLTVARRVPSGGVKEPVEAGGHGSRAGLLRRVICTKRGSDHDIAFKKNRRPLGGNPFFNSLAVSAIRFQMHPRIRARLPMAEM